MNTYKNLLFILLTTSTIIYCAVSETISRSLGLSEVPGLRLMLVLIIPVILYAIIPKGRNASKSYTLVVTIFFFSLIYDILFNGLKLSNIYGFFSTFAFAIVFVCISSIIINKQCVTLLLKSSMVILISVAVPSVYEGLMSGTSLRNVTYVYRELGQFGLAMNVCLILALALFMIKNKKIYFFIALIITVVIISTILKKSILEAILVWVIFLYFINKSFIKLFTKGLLIFILTLPILFIYINDYTEDFIANIEYYQAAGDQHVRLIMYITAFKILIDNFPFGSGFGTFGSPASVYNGYSQIYIDYGVDTIAEMSPEAVELGISTLFDTYWPHLIGELGVIGFGLFIILWFFPLYVSRFYIKRLKSNIFNLSMYFIIFSYIVLLTLEGLALYNPEAPLFIVLYWVLVAIPFGYIKYSFKNEIQSRIDLPHYLQTKRN